MRRVPGEQDKQLVDFGEVHPPDHEHDKVRSRCRGNTKGIVVQDTVVEEPEEEETSGSESSSSSSTT